MDPVSVLGVASSVIQFVQFGGSLVSKTRQLYPKGKLVDHSECENAAKRLSELTHKIKSSLNVLKGLEDYSSGASTLGDICDNCIELSAELLSRLAKLRVDEDHKHRTWKSFRKALKSVYSKDGIDGLARRIASCELQKEDTLGLQQQEAIALLNETSKSTIETILNSCNVLKKDLLDHTDNLLQSTSEQHKKTKASILLALGEAQSIEIYILRSLRFSTMNHRRMDIAEAHQKTFSWIFDESPSKRRPWSNFVKWLREGSGLYWINGKAGSEKSTLLRYIYENNDTRQHLRTWSKGSDLGIAAFFFWNSGSEEQRSQTGLLRSLLYQALKEQPSLVQHVFPDEWVEGSLILAQNDHFSDYNWTLSELKAAFKRWTLLAPSLSKRLCFFVDGLDEYEGDHEEMSELFKDISSSPSSHIKMYVSSRPLVVPDEVFGAFPGLHLQDLTRPNIESYVNDKLQAHHRMRRLTKVEPEHAAELVEEIITKASGVFLWVTIVVKSLLSGLLNRDKIEDLRRRLQELPSELGSLYAHMLSRVDSFYREQSSRAFQIFSYLASIHRVEVNALEFQIAISATPQTMMDEPLVPMSKDERACRQEEVDIYLKSRCAGLLEIHQEEYCNILEDNENDEDENDGSQNGDPLKARVAYLHITVKDFLASKEAKVFFSRAGHSLENFSHQFDIDIKIILLHIIELKRSVLTESSAITNFDIWELTKSVMRDCKKLENAENPDYIGFLDELCHAGCHLWRERGIDDDDKRDNIWDPIYRDSWNKRSSFQRLFLGEAVVLQLCSYVQAKLKQDSSLISDPRLPPLLNFAFRSDNGSCPPHPSRKMVGLLLRLGADPDQLRHGNTPWQHALSLFHKPISSLHRASLLSEYRSIFVLMLSHGASIYTTCTNTHYLYNTEDPCENLHSVRAVINELFRETPSEAAELHRLLDERASVQNPKSSSRESESFHPGRPSKRRACEPFEEEPRKRGSRRRRSYG